jgi:hypothetical protein
MASSKKGISALYLQRSLDLTSFRPAWFLPHRDRAAVDLPVETPAPLGGYGRVVEANETVIGGEGKNTRLSKRNPKNIGAVGKQIAGALVERDGGARPFHVVSSARLGPIIREHVSRQSALMTDDAGQYRPVVEEFARHEAINHGIERP